MDGYDSVFSQIRCSVHHGIKKNYLTLDKKTFQVLCSLCLEEGVTPKRKNLIIVDPNVATLDSLISKEEENAHHCYKHNDEVSLFYCEDCAQFICKTCFATEHRNHSSSTFDLIIEEIKSKNIKLEESLNELNKKIDESHDTIENLNNFYVTEKENFKTNLNKVKEKLNKALDEKANEYKEQIESFFNGVDNEVELNVQKLEGNRKKAERMLEEFTKMKNEVDLINDDKKICLYKKEKDNTILDNKQFLSDIENFLREQLNKTKEKVINEEDSFKIKCENLKKNISIYENSVINTIISGIPNICMRIRRFRKFSNSKSKYFKTDSLCMLCSNSINLAGFALCGLIHEHNQPLITYKINLKIFELDNVQKFDNNSKEILSIDVDIPVITNIVDPVYQFYLKNSVTISKNKLYFIIIKNLSNMTFVNTWSGNVGKELDDNINQHSIISNNSNVKFNFLSAFGVESDFNEFSEGIISDIIYSQIE
jgi:hypothetical protein